jgi:hypothetical protein
MKRLIIIFSLGLFCLNGFSQNYRLTVSNSNIYFNNFNEHKVFFFGFSGDYNILIKRFGIDFNVNFYLPKTYYGHVSYLDLNDLINKTIPVYAKGSAFSVGFGINYDILRTKSEKFKIIGNLGFINFDQTAVFDEEPFLRIYGGTKDIYVSCFSYDVGLIVIYKIGYIPLHLSVKKAFSIDKQQYNDFKVPGFIELDAGISFPILKSPPPTKIKKINLE